MRGILLSLIALLFINCAVVQTVKTQRYNFVPSPRPSRTFIVNVPENLPIKPLPSDGTMPKMITN